MSHYTDVLECLGDSVGADEFNYERFIGQLAQAGAGIYGTVKEGQDAKKMGQADAARAADAVKADQRAAQAEGVAAFAEATARASATAAASDPSKASAASQDAQRAQAARAAANQAMMLSRSAGMGLSPQAQQARVQEANKYAARMADASIQAAQASSNAPGDMAKRAAMDQAAMNASAAAMVASQVGMGMFQPGQPGYGQYAMPDSGLMGFLKKEYGGVPVYGWGVVGGVVVGGLLWWRNRRSA